MIGIHNIGTSYLKKKNVVQVVGHRRSLHSEGVFRRFQEYSFPHKKGYMNTEG